MTASESSPSITESWAEDPLAAAAALGIGILLGAAATFGLVQILATGDEPPIRVRNGSIELEVLHKSRHWTGSGNPWKINQGSRLSNKYWMYLAPTDPAHCKNNTKLNGDVILFILSDDKPEAPSWVQVKSTGNKTEVTSSKTLTRSADKKILSYGAAGLFIKTIKMDGSEYCTFGEKDKDLHSLLTE